jgi:RNA polymerase sigma-70 factor (ECF subfamily)
LIIDVGDVAKLSPNSASSATHQQKAAWRELEARAEPGYVDTPPRVTHIVPMQRQREPLPKNSDDELAAIYAGRRRSTLDAQQALVELYDRHARGLLAFLKSRLSASDAEDVHQDVWTCVLRSLRESFQGGSFRGWLFQIARNRIIDLRRKKRPETSNEWNGIDGQTAPPDEPLLHQERTEVLRQCMEQLDRQAAALVRARLGGDAYEVICQRLELQSAQAHKMFHTAKKRLEDCVQQKLGR